MHQILLYYKYVHIENPEAETARQRELCERLNLKGRIIVASEGINGTVEGLKENTDKYIEEMVKDKRFADIHWKKSVGIGNAFPKLSVKLRAEIVTLGLNTCDTCPVTDREGSQRSFICNGIDPNQVTGIHLKPEELHEWLETKKEFYIVDMRNVYEHKVGHFENSILPPIENFRDLPKVVEQIAHLKNKTVLTVCTGGVRCEKASGFLITQGFKDVYQLGGGIVSYMEKYPNEDFKGKLYVFDNRITQSFYSDDPKHEIVAKCDTCGEKSENYVNCANPVCHRHFITCEKCI
ncbi:MAG: rhodanese-related sulfurtransferase, partial [Patescibacteria group bacterium]